MKAYGFFYSPSALTKMCPKLW